MSIALLLLPAIAGYWALTHCNYTRFQAVRETGYHIFLRSAFVGAVLFGVARAITFSLDKFGVSPERWAAYTVDPYSAEVVLSLALGIIAPYIVNCGYSANRGARRSAERDGDDIELLLTDAVETANLVELTLRSRKVYIGFILNSGLGRANQGDISIAPALSGYRHRHTQDLVITTDYRPVIRYSVEFAIRREDVGGVRDFNYYRVAIPLAEVVSARLFNFDVFEEFQRGGESPSTVYY